MLLGHCNAAVGYNYTSYGMAGTRYMDTQLKADIERFEQLPVSGSKVDQPISVSAYSLGKSVHNY